MTRSNEAALRSGVKDRITTVSMCMSGNRGTLKDTIPRKSVTVCAGTNCEKATRKEICKGIVPLMDVKLEEIVNIVEI